MLEVLSTMLSELTYSEETGRFRRKDDGMWVETNSHRGYLRVKINGKRYLAHRLAWLYVYGRWPENEIDHINGNASDNRIENLRLATRAQNCSNVVKRVGACGVFGIYKPKHTNKFRAQISVDGKRKHLGYFYTKEEGHKAAIAALDKFRGEFSPAKRILGVA